MESPSGDSDDFPKGKVPNQDSSKVGASRSKPAAKVPGKPSSVTIPSETGNGWSRSVTTEEGVAKSTVSRSSALVSRNESMACSGLASGQTTNTARQTGNAAESIVPPNKKQAIDVERRSAWTVLLETRPDPDDDGDAMSAWLMKVMATSDMERPLHVSGKSSAPSATLPARKSNSSDSSSSSRTDGSGGALNHTRETNHLSIDLSADNSCNDTASNDSSSDKELHAPREKKRYAHHISQVCEEIDFSKRQQNENGEGSGIE
jgi:hypothetical protein